MLFGEWGFAVHSVRYDTLPDWFLAFDVYDRRQGRFWSSSRRDALTESLGLARVPVVAKGHFTAEEVTKLFGPSSLSHAPMEGVYLRRDEGDSLLARAKLVRPECVQAIEEHRASRPLAQHPRFSQTQMTGSPRPGWLPCVLPMRNVRSGVAP